ncbi:Calpain-6 [Chytriomyces hyalinus]|nr:Calpain-6 [Chytriomyces hyalinus]
MTGPHHCFNGQDYAKLFSQHARARQRFTDNTFLPNDQSLFGQNRAAMPPGCDIVWTRACELAAAPCLFDRSSVAASVTPGAMGSHWLVSAVAALTIHPALIARVVPDAADQDWVNNLDARKRGSYYNGYHKSPDLHPGIFRFRFFQFGEWVEVVVDDYLPCTREGELIYARSLNRSEFWISLLEKAYAKLHGSYAAISTGSPSSAFLDLSGNVPECVEIGSDEYYSEFTSPEASTTGTAGTQESVQVHSKLFEFMAKELGNKSMISCSMQQRGQHGALGFASNNVGLIYGHSYAVMDIVSIKVRLSNMRKRPVNLVKLRNPAHLPDQQSGGGFTGAWSLWSQDWQLVTRRDVKKLGLLAGDDGSFFMSFQDFTDYFTSIIICRQVEQYGNGEAWQFYSEWSNAAQSSGGSIRNPSTFPQNPQFLIHVSEPTQVIINVIQNDLFFPPTPTQATSSSNAIATIKSMFTPVEASTSRRSSTIFNYSKETERRALNSIGFTILKVEENRKFRVHQLSYEVTAIIPYTQSREIFSRLRMEPGRYVLFPTTLNTGEEGEFLLRVMACHTGATTRPKSHSLQVSPLLKHGPTPPTGAIRALDKALTKSASFLSGSYSTLPASLANCGWMAPIGVFRVELVQCDRIQCRNKPSGVFILGGGCAMEFFGVLKFVDGVVEGRKLKESVLNEPVPPVPPPPAAPSNTLEWIQSMLSASLPSTSVVPPAAEPVSAVSESENETRKRIMASNNSLLHRHVHRVVSTRMVSGGGGIALADPVWNESFMWPVRRPREASLLIEIWSRFKVRGQVGFSFGDTLLGSVAVQVEEFVGRDRQDRAWEIRVPLEAAQQKTSSSEKITLDEGTLLLRVKFESTAVNL